MADNVSSTVVGVLSADQINNQICASNKIDAQYDSVIAASEINVSSAAVKSAPTSAPNTAATNTTKTPAATTTPAKLPPYTGKLARNLVPVQGTFKVCFAYLDWPGTKERSSLNKVGSLARGVTNRYKELSNGKLIFNSKAVRVAIPESKPYAAKNIGWASNEARNRNPGYDRYVIVTGGLGTSHAGGKTAQVRGTLLRDGLHEMGHVLPMDEKVMGKANTRDRLGNKRVLGHAGAYVVEKGKLVLKAYNDGASFMGRFSSVKLNAPQMYYVGWSEPNRTGQYDFGTETTEKVFPLQVSTAKPKVENSLTGVLISRPNDRRDMFLSKEMVNGKAAYALHFMYSGGTQRRAYFGSKPQNLEGMTFEEVSNNGSYSTIKIKTNA